MSRIIEAGHYYAAKGPTLWSQLGWGYLRRIKKRRDRTLLFVDDIHPLVDVSTHERELGVVKFHVTPDFTVLESEVTPETEEIFQRLLQLPKRKRPRERDGCWILNGGMRLKFPGGTFSCVMLDAGLTLRKMRLGFSEGINVIPFFYESEQRNLLKIIEKVLPEFSLRVVLIDHKGEGTILK